MLQPTVFACHKKPNRDYDLIQCPKLLRYNGKYYIYASWYQYAPKREMKGLAIWEGTSLSNPDFVLKDTVALPTDYTCFRTIHYKFFDELLFLPIPTKHDVWHFDLFEYDGKLYMVSVAENGHVIMLSESQDYKHFHTFRTPLVHSRVHSPNAYSSFYKPTAFVKNDSLYLYYSSYHEPQNILYLTKDKLNNILNTVR